MKIKGIINMAAAVLAIGFGLTACSPDDLSMGANEYTSADLKEGEAYTITHDAQNPNIIYLESKMGNQYLANWETPKGRYQAEKVTLQMPFAGKYDVLFGISTRNGVVYADTAHFTIDSACLDFVTGKAWSLLAGGVGKSKTWVYDNGQYGYSKGELTYGDPSVSANNPLRYGSFEQGWPPDAGQCATDDLPYDSYKNSTMTFGLSGSASYTYYNSATGTTSNGVFSLNEDSYVLSLSDADLMHPDSWTDRRSNWRQNLQILELDENHMRIGYVRLPGNWGGEWVEVFNYVSKEYADNYVPPVDDNPQPTLNDTWKEDISSLNRSPNTYREIKWVLTDEGDACAYYDLYGKYKDGKQTATEAGLGMSLVLNSVDNSYTMTNSDGDTKKGTYTLTDDGYIQFSDGLLNVSVGSDGAVLKTNGDNKLRVLSYNMDGTEVQDIVLGYDLYDVHGNRYEYQGFRFVPKVIGEVEQEYFNCQLIYSNSAWTTSESSKVKITGDGKYTLTIKGADSDPYLMYLDVKKVLVKYPNFKMTITGMRVDGEAIDFDDTLIDTTTGDEKDSEGVKITARRYILNPWNDANYFTVNGTGVLKFSSSIEVDIDVKMDSGEPHIRE